MALCPKRIVRPSRICLCIMFVCVQMLWSPFCLLFHLFTSSPFHMDIIRVLLCVCLLLVSVCLSIQLCVPVHTVYFVHCATCRTRLKRFVCRNNPVLKLANEREKKLFVLKRTSIAAIAILVRKASYVSKRGRQWLKKSKRQAIEKQREKHTVHAQHITKIPAQRIRQRRAYPRGAFHLKTFEYLDKMSCDKFSLDMNLLNGDRYIFSTVFNLCTLFSIRDNIFRSVRSISS